MNIEEFRNFCLSMDGVTEKTPFGKFARRYDSLLVFYLTGYMKQANLKKKQRDDALSTWQKLTAYLDENKSKIVEEVAERLPEGYVFEEFIRDSFPKVYPAVVVTKLPWQSLLSFNSFAGYVTNHSEVQYFNMKTKEWEESLYYYY